MWVLTRSERDDHRAEKLGRFSTLPAEFLLLLEG